MKSVYLDYISLTGPGLTSWQQALPVLQGLTPYEPQPIPNLAPSLLPANERRRITSTIKLALHVAQLTLEGAAIDAGSVHSVFASCAGDSDITDRLCRALALPERPVSPIHFHNSVHNAPAGYWAIAVESRAPSTSVAAGVGTFAAGLIEAATQVLIERAPVLLVVYDSQPPTTLSEPSEIRQGLGLSLLLMPQPGPATLCELALAVTDEGEQSRCEGPLEGLRLDNPAARALPLLKSIADRQGAVALPYLNDSLLRVEVRPC